MLFLLKILSNQNIYCSKGRFFIRAKWITYKQFWNTVGHLWSSLTPDYEVLRALAKLLKKIFITLVYPSLPMLVQIKLGIILDISFFFVHFNLQSTSVFVQPQILKQNFENWEKCHKNYCSYKIKLLSSNRSHFYK